MATTDAKKVSQSKDENGEYDEMIKCSNGFFNVRKNVRYGYLNSDGEQITPIKYEAPADFRDGFATVKHDRSYFRLDENGQETQF